MTVKALKKQLMAAIAMVVVSAIALSSSTYAWFANNAQVSATGLAINAQAEGTMLIIAATEDGLSSKGTSVGLNLSGANLHPVHPIYEIGSAITAWNHRYSDSFNTAITATSAAEAAKTITVTDNVGKDGNDAYYLTGSVWIALDNANSSATAANLRPTEVTIAGGGGEAKLLKTARVMMVVEDKVVGVYSCDGQITTDRSADGTNSFVFGTIGEGSDIIKSPLNAGDKVKVDLYIYFDGRDENCTSEKFDATQVTVTLKFGATI